MKMCLFHVRHYLKEHLKFKRVIFFFFFMLK